MEVPVSIDFGIPMPKGAKPDMFERAGAACKTLETLLDVDPDAFTPDITLKDEVAAAKFVAEMAGEEDTAVASTKYRKMVTTPGTVIEVNRLLSQHAHAVVQNANQIRHLVTNKLMMEIENPDPKIRLRALELLGKISDVGLFSEKTEVTITHRSTEELRQSLREKLLKIKAQPAIVDVMPVEVAGETIDLHQELGTKAPDA